MSYLQSTLCTSLDDFVTIEEHLCIWVYYPKSYDEPEELSLISVDGMGYDTCPDDLWSAALEYEYHRLTTAEDEI